MRRGSSGSGVAGTGAETGGGLTGAGQPVPSRSPVVCELATYGA